MTENDNRLLNSDDLLIQQFFAENQVEIADNGFTEQVIRSLPRRSLRLNRIWTAICVVVGAVLIYTKLPELQFSGLRAAALYSLRAGCEQFLTQLSAVEFSLQNLTMVAVGILTLTVMAVYSVVTDERL